MSSIKSKLTNYPWSIILGSASPRRQELLKGLGFSFITQAINANEDFPPTLRAEEIPLFLAEKKSAAFPNPLKENELLITSDTIVWHNDIVLNKPQNKSEAIAMLTQLSGSKHEVYTAVCLRSISKQISFYDCTSVFFKPLNEQEIEYYIDTCNVYDKAGSYGAQDWIGFTGVEKIEGNYFNVMGLPVQKLWLALMEF